MSNVECPIEGCGYEDTVNSVEAHVSGCTYGAHKGESGWNFREQLRSEVEAGLNEVEPSTESAAGGVIAATLALVVIVVVSS